MRKDKITSRPNIMTDKRADALTPQTRSSPHEIADFLKAAKATAPLKSGDGRLIFALDATMSRQPTWDLACELQSQMFLVADKLSGLAVQLIYFRGLGECRASRWTRSASDLAELMRKISCQGGRTQISKVLSHALKAAETGPIGALIYIGDAMEENIDALCVKAGELGLRKVPCFMFHEGRDPVAESSFREIARLSSGAYVRFDPSAAHELAELLKAVATFAAGGRTALENQSGKAARLLLNQIGSGKGGGR